MLAAAIVLLTLLTATGLTAWQARVARRERDKAERRFNQVRKLARSVVFDYYDAVEKLPGATPVRELMVKDALEYLDNLSAESVGDPALQSELATAYEKVGDVQGNPYSANLRNHEGALASYGKARMIRESLFARSPNDLESRRKLADNCNVTGDVLLGMGANEKALANYRRGTELYEGLKAADPTNKKDAVFALSPKNKIGRVQKQTGDFTGALTTFRECLTQMDALYAGEPKNERYIRGLAIAQATVGDVLFYMHDYQGALNLFLTARSLFQQLSDASPTNTELKRDLAIMGTRTASGQQELKKYGEAIETNDQILLILEELATDPKNSQITGDIAWVYCSLGEAHSLLGHSSIARENLRLSSKFSEDILSKSPDLFTARTTLGKTHMVLAELLERDGDSAGALENFRKTLAILEVEPVRSDDPGRLARAYEEMGDLETKLANKAVGQKVDEHLEAARKLYQQSSDVWLDLQQRNKLASDERIKPDNIARKLSQCNSAIAKVAR